VPCNGRRERHHNFRHFRHF